MRFILYNTIYDTFISAMSCLITLPVLWNWNNNLCEKEKDGIVSNGIKWNETRQDEMRWDEKKCGNSGQGHSKNCKYCRNIYIYVFH